MRVLVLYGGQSSEHAVSCVTAAGVLSAIDGERFEVVPVGITSSGQWTRPSVDPSAYSFSGTSQPSVAATESSVLLHAGVSGSGQPGAELLEVLTEGETESLGHIDVVLPLLHGPFGEDGTIQGMLETFGVPYVGAGVLASAVGMDKHFTKIAFATAGLRVGDYQVITAQDWAHEQQRCIERAESLGFPVFVKPSRAGSSVGISRVEGPEGLSQAICAAQAHDPKVIVEAEISGREIECGVLDSPGNAPARASLLGEVVVGEGSEQHQFYDFTAKYTDAAAAELSCPADLPDEVTAEIRRQAVVAFKAVDAEGISRVDFFWDPEGGSPEKAVMINEINTMPGFTPISMYPQMWAATGIDYSDLITELITLAMDRPLGLR